MAEKQFGCDDRRYMVRVLATMLLSHISRPSMKDCELVAKALIQKFPFLEEYVCVGLYAGIGLLWYLSPSSILGRSLYTLDVKTATASSQKAIEIKDRLRELNSNHRSTTIHLLLESLKMTSHTLEIWHF